MKIKNLLIILSSLFLSFTAYAGGHKYSGPDLTGQKVVMFGPWLSPEQETMREVGAIFEKATGATFEYGGSDSFEQQSTTWSCCKRSSYGRISSSWR